MKDHVACVISVVLFAALMCPAVAHAADGSKKENAKKEAKAVKPPENAVAIPRLPPPPEVVSSFPALPPASPCTAKDMLGLFHLSAVYEEPQGTETSAFKSSPNQYMHFGRNNIYARVNMEQPNMSIASINDTLKAHSASLLQYIIQDNGFVYFYQNSVAVDVQACFIVASDKLPFETGQMLLIPPKGQILGRLVKVYDRMGPSPADKKEGGGGKNKKRKKGKKGRKGKKRRNQ